ncbi:MAG: CDP-alcohol phosphatidyltransferase family protein [Marinoscillum sp.]
MYLSNILNRQGWPLFHSVVILVSTAIGVAFKFFEIVWLANVLTFVIGLYLHRRELQDFPLLVGYANLVTLVRFILLATLFVLSEYLIVLFIMSVMLVLDGVDGAVARKTNTSTRIGAYLDMETDALYVLLISGYLVAYLNYNPWLIGVGLLRYLYEVFTWVAGVQDKHPPRTRFGPAAAVCLFIALLTPLVLPEYVAMWLVYIGVATVVASFGYSAWHQFGRCKT